MNDDRPIDIDQVRSDDSSMASGSSSGKKRAGAPAKYVWQYFKRYKDPYKAKRDIILNQRAKEPTEKVKKRKVDGRDQPLLEDDTHEEVEQTPDELDDSLRSMYEDCNTDWTSSPCQEELDIALHYDITDKLWDGEYVTLEAGAAVAPIGNDEDAADMDLQQMLAWQ
ncbi:TPA: hypothetical protein ACH3X1_006738 [Trebouxia sp. C0004]